MCFTEKRPGIRCYLQLCRDAKKQFIGLALLKHTAILACQILLVLNTRGLTMARLTLVVTNLEGTCHTISTPTQ